jgi:lambda family phage portal protein
LTMLIDAAISILSPSWALKRAQARQALAYYESARPDKQRKQRRERASGSAAVQIAGTSIREQARHLEQNFDLARGILRSLVNNTVGAHGITVEPQPLGSDGEVDEDFAQQILDAWEEWGERPDVTRSLAWPAAQRLFARTGYRDGEAFCRFVTSGVRHSTEIPLSIELLEPDLIPIGHNSVFQGRQVRDAIELGAWGNPLAYWAYKDHPGSNDASTIPWSDMRRISADEMIHYAHRDRLHQRRGMSLFAAILARIDDLKDYETSEAVAAKVAASLGAAIIKGSPELYPAAIEDEDDEPRDLRFRAGMIFDDLAPGERVEMIGSNGRPNPELVNFRNSLLKATATGTGAAYPAVSKDYDGSYSAQRQQLIDSWVDFAVMSQDLAATLVRPVYRRVIQSAIGVGRLSMPRGMSLRAAVNATYTPPSMPWIAPDDEAKAWSDLEKAGHASGPEVIRKRGRSPSDVLREQVQWKKQREAAGLPLNEEVAPATAQPRENEEKRSMRKAI